MPRLAVQGVDPTQVNTAAELAVCLDGLRRRRGLSYEAMAAAASRLQSRQGGSRWEPLAKSTVGEIVTGARLPSKGKLLTFLAVCGIVPSDLAQWLAAWERAATADLSRPAVQYGSEMLSPGDSACTPRSRSKAHQVSYRLMFLAISMPRCVPYWPRKVSEAASYC